MCTSATNSRRVSLLQWTSGFSHMQCPRSSTTTHIHFPQHLPMTIDDMMNMTTTIVDLNSKTLGGWGSGKDLMRMEAIVWGCWWGQEEWELWLDEFGSIGFLHLPCVTLGARVPGTGDYMLRTLRSLVKFTWLLISNNILGTFQM